MRDPLMMNTQRVLIRAVAAGDAPDVARLCHQLRYPSTVEAVERRLGAAEREGRHAVYVAEGNEGVVGWVHVYVCSLLVVDAQAEIGGLVVDEAYRQQGVGRQLMQQAEDWARSQGCRTVYLRSNINREEAHAFYRSIGYHHNKTSLVFLKTL